MDQGDFAWRRTPILEAVLRIERHGRLATPEAIADEAILHLDDVREGIKSLVEAGFLDILVTSSQTAGAVTSVAAAAALRNLVRAAPRPDSIDAQSPSTT